jgi:hypothetical protein
MSCPWDRRISLALCMPRPNRVLDPVIRVCAAAAASLDVSAHERLTVLHILTGFASGATSSRQCQEQLLELRTIVARIGRAGAFVFGALVETRCDDLEAGPIQGT